MDRKPKATGLRSFINSNQNSYTHTAHIKCIVHHTLLNIKYKEMILRKALYAQRNKGRT